MINAIKDVVFIRKFSSGRSAGSATVKVVTKKMFIAGILSKDRHDVQFCKMGMFSDAICSMRVDDFENTFSKEEIETMQHNGMLNYYPDASYVSTKYPMFGANVYKKYGVKMECKR